MLTLGQLITKSYRRVLTIKDQQEKKKKKLQLATVSTNDLIKPRSTVVYIKTLYI